MVSTATYHKYMYFPRGDRMLCCPMTREECNIALNGFTFIDGHLILDDKR